MVNATATTQQLGFDAVPTRHPYLDHPGPLAIAHRGGAGEAPENTIEAFQRAVDLGYAYLETDVHASADGVLFAFHDESLARVTDTDAIIGDLTASELDEVIVERRARIPRLAELLTTWPTIRLNIDPKSDGAIEPLVHAVKTHNAIDRVCIGSFSDRRIAYCRAHLGPALCTSMGPRAFAALRSASLGGPSPAVFDDACAQIPTTFRGRPLLDEALVATAHANDLQVHVWTIDEPTEMHELLDLGVDGLITDEPAALRDVLIQRGQWRASDTPSPVPAGSNLG